MINNYDNSSIKELVFPDTVRQKVGMYLGSSGKDGFLHTINEIRDNSLDEFDNGHGDRLDVEITEDTVTISDNGRGIPADIDPNKSAMLRTMTTLHSSGKHKNTTKTAYKFSSGVNGVGASCVNATSDNFVISSCKDGIKYIAEFSSGKLVNYTHSQTDLPNGTTVRYKPSIKKDEFDEVGVFSNECQSFLGYEEEIIDKFKYLPYLSNGSYVNLKLGDKTFSFSKQSSFSNLLEKETNLVETFNMTSEMTLVKGGRIEDGIKSGEFYKPTELKVAINFNPLPTQLQFANNILVQGGKHYTSFLKQVTNILNKTINKQYTNKAYDFTKEDILTVMSFAISIKVDKPEFKGQTKEKLDNSEASIITTEFCKRYLPEYFKNIDLKQVLKLLELAKKSRLSKEKIDKNIYKEVSELNEFELALQKGKLTDCTGKEPEHNTLFLTEGDSASGQLKQVRDSRYHAILPLGGKPRNVYEASIKDTLKDKAFKSLIYALGGYGKDFDIEKLKYGKIGIFADADHHGFHIKSLLLTFFYKYYPELIDGGYVYVVDSPRYVIRQNGKSAIWCLNDREKDEALKNVTGKYKLERNKGLGALSTQDLYETAIATDKYMRQIVRDELSEEALRIFMSNEGLQDRKKILLS
jgi:DNA gyrase subunit B